MLRNRDEQQALDRIREIVGSQNPELIARIPGGLSFQVMLCQLSGNYSSFSTLQRNQLEARTGFYSTRGDVGYLEDLKVFADRYLLALRESTMCIRNQPETESVETLLESTVEGYLDEVFVWNSDKIWTWTPLFSGCLVLIVSPFVETMRKQLAHRHHLHKTGYPHSNFDFPECEMSFLKAPLTLQGCALPHRSWVETSDELCRKSDSIDFDIALVSCGSYAQALAHHIYKSGRKAMVAGGVLQTLFGIKGNRWSRVKGNDVSEWYNEFWTNPSIEETPPKSEFRPEYDNFWERAPT